MAAITPPRLRLAQAALAGIGDGPGRWQRRPRHRALLRLRRLLSRRRRFTGRLAARCRLGGRCSGRCVLLGRRRRIVSGLPPGSALMMLIAGIEAEDGNRTCRMARHRSVVTPGTEARAGAAGAAATGAAGVAGGVFHAAAYTMTFASKLRSRRLVATCRGSRNSFEAAHFSAVQPLPASTCATMPKRSASRERRKPFDRGLVAAVARSQFEAVGQERKTRIHIGHCRGDRLRISE